MTKKLWLEEEDPPELVDLVAHVSKHVLRRVKSMLRNDKAVRRNRDADEVNSFAESIADDFVLFAQALFLHMDFPELNGNWLSYKAGRIPVGVFRIEGRLADLIDVSPERAAELVDAAGRVASAKVDDARQAEASLQSQIDAVGGVPSGHLLKRILHSFNQPEIQAPETRILTTAEEVKGVRGVPPEWRSLLKAQSRGDDLPWDAIWDRADERFPAIRKFLQQRCVGVALLLRSGKDPALLYLAENRHTGERSWSAWIAGAPIGRKPPSDKEAAKRLKALPPALRTFYQDVHDGWCDLDFGRGPLPLEKMDRLDRFLSDEEAFEGRRKRPFHLHDYQKVLGNSGGDSLCIDTSQKPAEPPKAIYFDHESPADSDLNVDFWKELNRHIEIGMEGTVVSSN